MAAEKAAKAAAARAKGLEKQAKIKAEREAKKAAKSAEAASTTGAASTHTATQSPGVAGLTQSVPKTKAEKAAVAAASKPLERVHGTSEDDGSTMTASSAQSDNDEGSWLNVGAPFETIRSTVEEAISGERYDRYSANTLQKRPFPCRRLEAIVCYGPLIAVVYTSFHLVLVLHQALLLPFRLCGGPLLVWLMHALAPLIVPLLCHFSTLSFGDACMGAHLDGLASYEDFLLKGPAKEKKHVKQNCKRNVKLAQKALEERQVDVQTHAPGTWRLRREYRDLIWASCTRHSTTTRGCSNLLVGGQPAPSLAVYSMQISLALVFPCELQTFRDRQGKLVALNTYSNVGAAQFHLNYACDEDYARCSLYHWSSKDQVEKAIQRGASVLNLLCTFSDAKLSLGFQRLAARTNYLACPCAACCSAKRGLQTVTVAKPPDVSAPADAADNV